MGVDTLPRELTSVLEAERQRVAAAAAASRARLARRLAALESVVGAGDWVPPGPVVDLRDPVGIRLPAEPALRRVPPDAPPPAIAVPAPPVPASPATAPPAPAGPNLRALRTSHRLMVLGGVVLAFVAHERYITPWVAHNGQGRLEASGAPGLQIPKLGLALSVAEGTGDPSLRAGPGHDPRSSHVGHRGNVVIAGHRTTYGAPFADLEALNEGDVITLGDEIAGITYTVKSVDDDVERADRLARAQHGDDRLTLVTASKEGRVVVVALADEGSRLDGELPAKGGGGSLWPTNTLNALVGIGLWSGAAFGLARGLRLFRARFGSTVTLLVIPPAAGLGAMYLFSAIEKALGTLY